MERGWVVILNGAPRSGKSSVALALTGDPDRRWVVHGVDAAMAATPSDLRPGIGLRPGGERPDLEEHVREGFEALYAEVARLARTGVSVAVDVGHHAGYSRPLRTHRIAARALAGLPTLVVGVRCGLEEVLRRRAAGGGYLRREADGTVPAPVARWQRAVHDPGIYDLELDTDALAPEEAAARVLARLATGPRGAALAAWADLP